MSKTSYLNMEHAISSFIESRCGNKIFLGDRNGFVHIVGNFDCSEGTHVRLQPKHSSVCKGNNGMVSQLLELRDGRLCSAGHDGTIRIWNVYLFMCLQVLEISVTPLSYPYGNCAGGSQMIELLDGSICFLSRKCGFPRDDDVEDHIPPDDYDCWIMKVFPPASAGSTLPSGGGANTKKNVAEDLPPAEEESVDVDRLSG